MVRNLPQWQSLEARRLLSAAVWTGDGANSLFSNANNWQGDVAPTAGQDITFASGAANTNVTIDSNITVGNVEFDASYDISPSTGSSNAIALNGNVVATVGNVAINTPIVLQTDSTITVYALAAVVDNAAISDGGNGFGISISGNGPLTLNGAGETYTGITSVMGGTLIDNAPLTSTVDDYTGASFTGDTTIGKMEGFDGTFTAANGASPAAVTIANSIAMDPNSGDTLNFDIGGPGDSSLFTVQAGTISLANANLSGTLVNGYLPVSSDVITLIKNETGAAISGTFDNLPQGAVTTIGGESFTVSYIGGSSGHDVTLTTASADGTVPTIVSATTNASTHGRTIAATVVGADASSAGAAGLTYDWSAVHVPAGAKQPTFSANNTNAAGSIIARFSKDGGYVLQCLVRNADGNSVSTDVYVTVSQKATSLKVEPHQVHIAPHHTQQFTATILDQFGRPMRTAVNFTWAIKRGSGSINSDGLFTAGAKASALQIEVAGEELSAVVGALVT
jgi:autotransporter-associated beta strand protein